MKRRTQSMLLDEWLPLLIVVGSLWLIDFAAWPMMSSTEPQTLAFFAVLACQGAVVAQATLLNLAVVFGSGPFWLRLIVAFGFALAAVGCWFVGVLLVDSIPNQTSISPPPLDHLRTCSFLGYLALMAQVPLWLTRIVCGWRFYSDGTRGNSVQQFSLADLLAATVLFCIEIGSMRAAGMLDPGHRRADDHWFDLGLTAVLMIVCSLFFVLPLVAMFFSKMSLQVAWLAALSYSLVLVIFMPVVSHAEWPFSGLPFLSVVACAAGIGAGCSLMRCCEVRWGRTAQTAVAPSR